MSGVFAAATAVTPIATVRAEAGETVKTFVSEMQPGWDIGGNANGGSLMAIAGRAMAAAVGRPPVTLTAHYLRPAPTGRCEIEVTTVRSGRRFATATASLVMFDGGDRIEIIRLLGTFGEQSPGGPSYIAEGPIDIADYDDCELPPAPGEGLKPAITERRAIRIFPGDEGFRTGNPTGEARIRGWFAFADHDPIDAIGLLLVADAFPAARVQHRIAGGVGADGRVDRAHPGCSGSGAAALLVPVTIRARRHAGRGRRGLGLDRHPRRPVAPARPHAAPTRLNPRAMSFAGTPRAGISSLGEGAQ